MKKIYNSLIKDKEVIQMTKENNRNTIEEQTHEFIKEVEKSEEKINSMQATLTTENGKIVSENVIIEIVHAFKEIIIEFIHMKYQTPSK